MTVIVVLVLAAGVAAYGYSQRWFGDPADDVSVGALPVCPPASEAPLTAADVQVNVYNSTARNGLASSVAEDLGKRSFVVKTVANDPLHGNVSGTALVRYGTKGAEAADLVRAQVPKATLKKDKRKGADVDLVLGDAFRRLAPVPTPTPTASASPTPSQRCTPAASPSSSGAATSTATLSPSATRG
jgi:hypothetical protein